MGIQGWAFRSVSGGTSSVASAARCFGVNFGRSIELGFVFGINTGTMARIVAQMAECSAGVLRDHRGLNSIYSTTQVDSTTAEPSQCPETDM